MNTVAVVMEGPQRLNLNRLELAPPAEEEVVVDIEYSGISTGTERLLWTGRMPHFPGMGYPLVPGYESVGRVTQAGAACSSRLGDWVFVPGARCFGEVRGLFGGAASRLVVASSRATRIDESLGEKGVLLALAATAYHAISARDCAKPDLIVGHGVLGRLMARLAMMRSREAPVVWEVDPHRAGADSFGYTVIHPDQDPRRRYRAIYDVSGDSSMLDKLIARLGRGGQVVLAGFYDESLSFSFPPAFMREARIRVAAEWRQSDLEAVKGFVETGELSLSGLITHRHEANEAMTAYDRAFNDPACLKMILDWRGCA
jgi:3-hydroxyethyl bacteriochlorophyllide a dehydrogenase